MHINKPAYHTASFGVSSTAVGGRRRRHKTRTKRVRRRTRTSHRRNKGRKTYRRRRMRGGNNPTYSAYSVGGVLSPSEVGLANPPPISRIDLYN